MTTQYQNEIQDRVLPQLPWNHPDWAKNHTHNYTLRRKLTQKYSWAIPSSRALETIALINKPILEVGAGLAYWAWELQRRGVDILPTDVHHPAKNKWNTLSRPWTDLAHGIQGKEAVKKFPNRILMMIWPYFRGYPWDYQTLKLYKGNIFIYVGEGYGGCTGTPKFHKELNKNWKESGYVSIPQWDGIRDELVIFERKNK